MTHKIFMTKSGKANITCPECAKVRSMNVSEFTSAEKAVSLKITCACGHGFSVTLERRLHFRKRVNLRGRVVYKDKIYQLDILDISRRGLKLKTERPIDIQKGEKLIIDFILDDSTQSQVEKEVIVKKINGVNIGVEFISHDHYDRLGPYLLFHFT